jgi:hypothetical protein
MKMKKIVKISIIALLVGSTAFTFSGCGKYEDGPSISLLTKKARVAGTWGVEKYMVNGVDQTAAWRQVYSSENLIFDKAGTYSATYNTILGPFTDAGTWAFINDKANLQLISSSANSVADVWEIIRLTNSELWVRETGSITTADEFHYMSK